MVWKLGRQWARQKLGWSCVLANHKLGRQWARQKLGWSCVLANHKPLCVQWRNKMWKWRDYSLEFSLLITTKFEFFYIEVTAKWRRFSSPGRRFSAMPKWRSVRTNDGGLTCMIIVDTEWRPSLSRYPAIIDKWLDSRHPQHLVFHRNYILLNDVLKSHWTSDTYITT